MFFLRRELSNSMFPFQFSQLIVIFERCEVWVLKIISRAILDERDSEPSVCIGLLVHTDKDIKCLWLVDCDVLGHYFNRFWKILSTVLFPLNQYLIE